MSDRALQLRGAIVAAVEGAQEAGREEERARRALERAEDASRRRVARVEELLAELATALEEGERPPLAMILHCPRCHAQHVDEGEFTTTPHHAHLCAGCGETWQPCARPTVGVREIESA